MSACPPVAGGDGGKPLTRHDTLPQAAFDATYKLHEELGRGASGTVFRATEHETGKEVAVKMLNKGALALAGVSTERCYAEVEILRRVNHPHIVSLIGVYESEEKLVLVLELVRGRELFDVIVQRGRISESEARSIFLQLADAIAYLHAIGILHRDIKPENVQVLDEPVSTPTAAAEDDKDNGSAAAARKRARGNERDADSQPVPQAKLLDFGLAKRLMRSTTSVLGGSVSIVGTPMYIAPEVERLAAGGRDRYDAQADMFSLGATLYVALWCVQLASQLPRDRWPLIVFCPLFVLLPVRLPNAKRALPGLQPPARRLARGRLPPRSVGGAGRQRLARGALAHRDAYVAPPDQAAHGRRALAGPVAARRAAADEHAEPHRRPRRGGDEERTFEAQRRAGGQPRDEFFRDVHPFGADPQRQRQQRGGGGGAGRAATQQLLRDAPTSRAKGGAVNNTTG